jgi:subfamily B ATP-binding cassette protein MsbA
MNTGLIRRFAPYVKLLADVKLVFAGGLVCGIINGATSGFGLPFMIYKVFPVVFSDPAPDWPILAGAIAMFPAVMLVRGTTDFFSTYLMAYCGVELLTRIRLKLHRKLQSLPLSFFHRNTVGDLFSRIMQDTQQFQMAVVDSSVNLIKQPVQLIGALAALIYLSIQQREMLFLLLFVGIIPAVVVPLRYVGKRLLKRASQLQGEVGNISQTVSENLNAAREVRAFNLQQRELNRFETVLVSFCRLTMKTVKYSKIMRPTIEFVSSIGVAAAIAYLIVSGIRWEEVAALFVALWATYDPLKKFGEVYNKLKRGEASLERIEYILEQEDNIPDPEQPAVLPPVQGNIEIQNVSFRYLDEWVLREINLSVPPGTVVALVGPSGAGKSTLADLLPRFYDVNEGCILIDGLDIRTVAKADLRSAISVVSQDTFLFNATIEENIRLGRLEASDADIREAARHAYAHDFIEQLEDGYATIVGDRGTRLSGGQKQRIAIARAFLKKSPVLILDEATSALDSESEEMIQKALEELVQGRTVFVIAHRFSTIRNAGCIVVLEEGRMVGTGSHDELYNNNDTYRRLYDRQFSA